MGIEALLKSAQGKAALDSVAASFGLNPAQTGPVVDALAGALSQRIERNMISRGGVADMVGLLVDPASGRALAEPKALASADVANAGNHVLDVLIGDKHISRGIAARTAADTGIDVETAKKLLPVVASMMLGGLQKQSNPEMTKLFRHVPVLAAASNGSPLPIPGDNIPGVGRNAPSSPEGAPGGGNNPFENLPDIIRRGGVQVPGGGGNLENVIRSILGNLLGLQNRGMIGNIIQALVVRGLVNLARRFFGGR
ncbi:MAG: DUF937 domain-containing protein [Hyphomicrobium sp.]